MTQYSAQLTNYNDHANAGLPLIFRIMSEQLEIVCFIDVDYDADSNPLFDAYTYTVHAYADCSEVVDVEVGEVSDDLLEAFMTAYEVFDIEDDTTFEFGFEA
jgi:hypothetical protein